MQGGNAQNKKRFIIVSLILILSLALPCFATVTESSGDGFSVYNGLKLPTLPSSDYPYSMFVENIMDDKPYYTAGFTNIPLVYNGEGVGSSSDVSVKFFLLCMDSELAGLFSIPVGVWTLLGEETETGFNFGDPYWSSFDIINTTDSSIYFAASDPVPLDGYHLIEWDGDRTGLLTDTVPFFGSNLYFSVVSDPCPVPGPFDYVVLHTSEAFQWGFIADLPITEFFLQDGSNWTLAPILSSVSSPPYSFTYADVLPVTLSYPGLYFGSSDSAPFYYQLYAYRESETEGPTGAVTGLNIITPPLGETDYIVYAGSELQCTAQVTGTGDFNPAVTWSLSYSPSAEYYPTISETGLLSVLPGVPEQRIFITATSVADPSIYATVPVYIMPPAVSSVTITPSSATAAPGQNVQFSATVSGSNVEDFAVTWAVGGASSASTRITRDGLLLIGSDEVSPVIAVRATSDQDGSVYGTALVTINVPAAVTGVTITPDDIVLNRGDVQQFTATVSGTGSYDNSVTWQITSVYSAGTSISNTGLLTIGEEQKYDYIIIKATSTADPSLSATAYVFVEDAISDPMNIDLSVLERLLEEIKNYLKTLQHIFDRPHYFREFNMYTGKLNEQEEQITGLTFNFYRFMQNMEEYVGSIAYTFANGAEVQIREDTTEGFDWFSLFFGKDSGSKVEKSDFAGISTIVTNTRDLFDTGFGFSDFFELIGSVPFFTDEVGSQLDTTTRQFDVRDPDPFNMSVLGNRDEQLEEWRNKHTD